MKIEKQTWLPIFKGFYGTNYINDDYLLENELQDYNLSIIDDNIKNWLYNNFYDYIDYFQFKIDFVIAYCKELSTDNIQFEYENINSPKEYNFANDSVNVKCTIKDFRIIKSYILENINDFEKYIKENYTSCSGFWSSYSNDINDWLSIIDNAQNEDMSHEFGSILQFYFLNQNDNIDYHIYENIAYNHYIDINSYIDYNKMIKDFNKQFKTDFESIFELIDCGQLSNDKIDAYKFKKSLKENNLVLFTIN